MFLFLQQSQVENLSNKIQNLISGILKLESFVSVKDLLTNNPSVSVENMVIN